MLSRAPSISSKHLIVLMFLRVIPKKTKRTDTLLQEYALCNRLKYVVIWRIDFFYSEIYFIRTKHILILQFALRDAHRCSPPSGGGAPTYDFVKFPKTLHEIEKILDRRGESPI